MYAWFPTLVAVFFMRFAYRRILAFEYVAAAVAVAAAPLLYLGAAFDQFGPASIAVRATVLSVISVALVAVLRYALLARTVEGTVLLAIGALCVVSAIRDFVLSLTSDELQPVYLTTYTGVLLILFAGWMLLQRYHRAYAAYEAFAKELDQRVQEVSGELRRRLAEVQAAREEAEQASLAKSHFFAAASHDLRQPLHSLGLFAAALGSHVSGTEGRQLVRHVGESIEALKRLFEELLDLSRLDAGHVRVELDDLALQDIFDRLSIEFHAEAVSRELRLRFAPTRLAVHSDAALLHRVLANLVSNALRYTRSGGVLVGARRRGQRAWIEVYDTGVGIAATEQSRIFDELYQVDNPGRDRSQGLGLGLAIVRRIANRLQHAITVRSEPGRGSCFRVELPLAGRQHAARCSRPSRSPPCACRCAACSWSTTTASCRRARARCCANGASRSPPPADSTARSNASTRDSCRRPRSSTCASVPPTTASSSCGCCARGSASRYLRSSCRATPARPRRGACGPAACRSCRSRQPGAIA